MSTQAALDALIRLEQQMLQEPVAAVIKGLLRPAIALESADGQAVGLVRSAVMLPYAPHQASLRLFDADISLSLAGFIERYVRLETGGEMLISVHNEPFTASYQAQDRQGEPYPLRRHGWPWNEQYDLVTPAGGAVIHCRSTPLSRRAALFASRRGEVKPGLVAGLALALFYLRFVSLRFALLAGGSAGGGGR